LTVLRKLFFWNYARNTWQWDTLCVVILIFIFLTPKRWFENGELNGSFLHQNRAETILLMNAEVVESTEDKVRLQQQLRKLRGRENLEVLSVRRLTDSEGKIKGYEVDIR
jgi:hypothetical protein